MYVYLHSLRPAPARLSSYKTHLLHQAKLPTVPFPAPVTTPPPPSWLCELGSSNYFTCMDFLVYVFEIWLFLDKIDFSQKQTLAISWLWMWPPASFPAFTSLWCWTITWDCELQSTLSSAAFRWGIWSQPQPGNWDSHLHLPWLIALGAEGALTCVGVMWLMSSDASCFSRVVLPALSKPRSRIRTSWSGALFSLRKIESKPLDNHERDRLLGGSDCSVSDIRTTFWTRLSVVDTSFLSTLMPCAPCSSLPSLSRSVGTCVLLLSLSAWLTSPQLFSSVKCHPSVLLKPLVDN